MSLFSVLLAAAAAKNNITSCATGYAVEARGRHETVATHNNINSSNSNSSNSSNSRNTSKSSSCGNFKSPYNDGDNNDNARAWQRPHAPTLRSRSSDQVQARLWIHFRLRYSLAAIQTHIKGYDVRACFASTFCLLCSAQICCLPLLACCLLCFALLALALHLRVHFHCMCNCIWFDGWCIPVPQRAVDRLTSLLPL